MHSIIDPRRDEVQWHCRQFGVYSLDVFCSAAGEGFDPQHCDFGAGAQADLFNCSFGLNNPLAALFGRRAGLVMGGGMVNPYSSDSVNALASPSMQARSPKLLENIRDAAAFIGEVPHRQSGAHCGQYTVASMVTARLLLRFGHGSPR